jgi:hypothetical protein
MGISSARKVSCADKRIGGGLDFDERPDCESGLPALENSAIVAAVMVVGFPWIVLPLLVKRVSFWLDVKAKAKEFTALYQPKPARHFDMYCTGYFSAYDLLRR